MNLACLNDLAGLSREARRKLCRRIRAASYADELERMYCLVAVEGGRVVGLGALDGSALKRMYVAPDHRGRGIGKGIYEKLEAEARRRGLQFLELESSMNAAEFYKRLGFARVREQTSCLDGVPVVNVLMRKRLK